jgi:hypothetical protein
MAMAGLRAPKIRLNRSLVASSLVFAAVFAAKIRKPYLQINIMCWERKSETGWDIVHLRGSGLREPPKALRLPFQNTALGDNASRPQY